MQLHAYNGYMRAGGPAAYSGNMGQGVPAAYGGTWGRGPAAYSGQGVQLLTVDRGSSCL